MNNKLSNLFSPVSFIGSVEVDLSLEIPIDHGELQSRTQNEEEWQKSVNP